MTRPGHSLSTLRTRRLPDAAARLASRCGPALRGGIGYPQGSTERFPRCSYIVIPLSQALPGATHPPPRRQRLGGVGSARAGRAITTSSPISGFDGTQRRRTKPPRTTYQPEWFGLLGPDCSGPVMWADCGNVPALSPFSLAKSLGAVQARSNSPALLLRA